MIEIIEILLTSVYFLECTVVQYKDALSIYWNRHGHQCSRIWKLSANFHAHSVHQNSVEIFWAEIYRGQLYFRAEIYRGRLLTLITGSSSRLLRHRTLNLSCFNLLTSAIFNVTSTTVCKNESRYYVDILRRIRYTTWIFYSFGIHILINW
jgi:hypothetical protein